MRYTTDVYFIFTSLPGVVTTEGVTTMQPLNETVTLLEIVPTTVIPEITTSGEIPAISTQKVTSLPPVVTTERLTTEHATSQQPVTIVQGGNCYNIY